MRKNAVLCPLLCSALFLGCHPVVEQREQAPAYAVSTHSYEFRQEKDTPAPAGFKPVYISHYGRHGSRTGMKVSDHYERVMSVLGKADSLDLLTDSGDSLYNEARFVYQVHNGMDGRLTRRGEAEEHQLAELLYRRYPSVFKRGCRKIRVELSTVPRSIVSGMCFVQTLTSLQSDLQFTFDTGEKFFAYINNTSSSRQTAAVLAHCDSLNAMSVSDGARFFPHIFKDPSCGPSLVGDPEEFQKLVWEMACAGEASGLEADMFRHLPKEVCEKWWADKLRRVYMRHGNSIEFGEERMKRAEPLVGVILRQAQQALSCGDVAADLKFGHDYPLISMAGYFGLDGVGDRLGWDDLPEAWSDPMNIPLATNMQIVFYRNRKGEVLVKFVYNGRERYLRDMEAVIGPYYNWNEVYERFIPERDARIVFPN